MNDRKDSPLAHPIQSLKSFSATSAAGHYTSSQTVHARETHYLLKLPVLSLEIPSLC